MSRVSSSSAPQSSESLLTSWLDRVLDRKSGTGIMTQEFQRTGVLPEGRAFVQGEYKTAETLQLIADEVAIDAADIAAEAHMDSMEAAHTYAMESPEELEAMLGTIFREADVNCDGTLQLKEHRVSCGERLTNFCSEHSALF